MITETAPEVSVRSRTLWLSVVSAHLLPGLALLAFIIVVTPLLDMAGYPGIWAALVGALVVQVPLLLALTRNLRRERRSAPELPKSSPRGPARRLLLGAVTLLAAFLLPGLVTWAEPLLRQTVFGWLPAWWSTGASGIADQSPTERLITVALWFAALVIAGPVAEEIYFRGELLRGVPLGPWTAAVCHAGLFAAYHLWQPYSLLTVFLFTLPIAVARRVFGAGVVTCCLVHCTVNAVMFAALVSGILQR